MSKCIISWSNSYLLTSHINHFMMEIIMTIDESNQWFNRWRYIWFTSTYHQRDAYGQVVERHMFLAGACVRWFDSWWCHIFLTHNILIQNVCKSSKRQQNNLQFNLKQFEELGKVALNLVDTGIEPVWARLKMLAIQRSTTYATKAILLGRRWWTIYTNIDKTRTIIISELVNQYYHE